jgi:hypothetical protein
LPASANAYLDMVAAWGKHKTVCELMDTAGNDVDTRTDFLAAEQVALNKALEKRDTYLEILKSKRETEDEQQSDIANYF